MARLVVAGTHSSAGNGQVDQTVVRHFRASQFERIQPLHCKQLGVLLKYLPDEVVTQKVTVPQQQDACLQLAQQTASHRNLATTQ
ncbi:MAG TPA: hypothetical protein VMV69_21175, partial [Pirellulales bacterium]|nr:hypothetical protein [Pirellulales bacterium]